MLQYAILALVLAFSIGYAAYRIYRAVAFHAHRHDAARPCEGCPFLINAPTDKQAEACAKACKESPCAKKQAENLAVSTK